MSVTKKHRASSSSSSSYSSSSSVTNCTLQSMPLDPLNNILSYMDPSGWYGPRSIQHWNKWFRRHVISKRRDHFNIRWNDHKQFVKRHHNAYNSAIIYMNNWKQTTLHRSNIPINLLIFDLGSLQPEEVDSDEKRLYFPLDTVKNIRIDGHDKRSVRSLLTMFVQNTIKRIDEDYDIPIALTMKQSLIFNGEPLRQQQQEQQQWWYHDLGYWCYNCKKLEYPGRARTCSSRIEKCDTFICSNVDTCGITCDKGYECCRLCPKHQDESCSKNKSKYSVMDTTINMIVSGTRSIAVIDPNTDEVKYLFTRDYQGRGIVPPDNISGFIEGNCGLYNNGFGTFVALHNIDHNHSCRTSPTVTMSTLIKAVKDSTILLEYSKRSGKMHAISKPSLSSSIVFYDQHSQVASFATLPSFGARNKYDILFCNEHHLVLTCDVEVMAFNTTRYLIFYEIPKNNPNYLYCKQSSIQLFGVGQVTFIREMQYMKYITADCVDVGTLIFDCNSSRIKSYKIKKDISPKLARVITTIQDELWISYSDVSDRIYIHRPKFNEADKSVSFIKLQTLPGINMPQPYIPFIMSNNIIRDYQNNKSFIISYSRIYREVRNISRYHPEAFDAGYIDIVTVDHSDDFVNQSLPPPPSRRIDMKPYTNYIKTGGPLLPLTIADPNTKLIILAGKGVPEVGFITDSILYASVCISHTNTFGQSIAKFMCITKLYIDNNETNEIRFCGANADEATIIVKEEHDVNATALFIKVLSPSIDHVRMASKDIYKLLESDCNLSHSPIQLILQYYFSCSVRFSFFVR